VYAWGRALHAAGRLAEARDAFEEALLRTPRPERANRRIIAALRRVAAEAGAPLADVKGRIEAVAPEGIPGLDLFADNCHLWEPGNALLQETLAEAVSAA